MNHDETIDLLSVIAAYDRRTVGEADVHAWHAAIGDLRFDDAREAVIRHYRDSREWLMPADVRRVVKAIRTERIQREDPPEPPPELDPDNVPEYIEWLGTVRTQIGDGTYIEPEDHPELEPRDMSAIKDTFRRIGDDAEPGPADLDDDPGPHDEDDRESIRKAAIRRARRELRERERPNTTPEYDPTTGSYLSAYRRAEIEAEIADEPTFREDA